MAGRWRVGSPSVRAVGTEYFRRLGSGEVEHGRANAVTVPVARNKLDEAVAVDVEQGLDAGSGHEMSAGFVGPPGDRLVKDPGFDFAIDESSPEHHCEVARCAGALTVTAVPTCCSSSNVSAPVRAHDLDEFEFHFRRQFGAARLRLRSSDTSR